MGPSRQTGPNEQLVYATRQRLQILWITQAWNRKIWVQYTDSTNLRCISIGNRDPKSLILDTPVGLHTYIIITYSLQKWHRMHLSATVTISLVFSRFFNAVLSALLDMCSNCRQDANKLSSLNFLCADKYACYDVL